MKLLQKKVETEWSVVTAKKQHFQAIGMDGIYPATLPGGIAQVEQSLENIFGTYIAVDRCLPLIRWLRYSWYQSPGKMIIHPNTLGKSA